jgi:hypothetical protein
MPKAPFFIEAGSLANNLFAFKVPSTVVTVLVKQNLLVRGNHIDDGSRSATLYGSKPGKLSNNHKGFPSRVTDQASLDLFIEIAEITPLNLAGAARRKASKS